MPWTFGGNTWDWIYWNGQLNLVGNGHSQLVMMWIRPTTLTAGKAIWTTQGSTRTAIHTTTDEIINYSSHNTTAGVWSTTGVDMAANNWCFLAWLFMLNTTPTAQYWHIWRGTPTTRPEKVTVTQDTAPSGTPQSSTDRLFCNTGFAHANSFQGDIAEVFFAGSIDGNTGPQSFFELDSANAISDSDAQRVYDRWILPYWAGNPIRRPVFPSSTDTEQYSFVFDHGPRGRQRFTLPASTPLLNITPSYSGQRAQFIRPESFVQSTNWTGAVTAIDEATADDADFVYSANNTAATLEIAMTNPTLKTGTGPKIRYRHAKTNAGVVDGGGNSVTVTGQLYEGGTQLATDTSQTTSGTWTTRLWSPTIAPTVNWDDVRIYLVTSASGGSPANRRGCGISWVEIEWSEVASPTWATTLQHPRRSRAPRFSYPAPLGG